MSQLADRFSVAAAGHDAQAVNGSVAGRARVNGLAESPAPPAHAASAEVLIRVDGVSKKFCRSLKKSLWYGVLDMAGELNPFTPQAGPGSAERQASPLRPDEFWAVNDVSFELRRGQCLGLIGRNGAGKTTLLKMLNGLMKPDKGRIEMHGRVGALIALGAGFNPILSGRENIYVYGSVLGLTKREIDEKLDDIIDFAEIREFIDAPVQSYSSGMNVRLGFAVATAMKPDVLILDEVLAVGDAAFRAKCFKRIGDMARDSAIVFVSHQQSHISRICDRALLFERGNVLYHGSVPQALEIYRDVNASNGHDQSALQLGDDVEAFEVLSANEDREVRAGSPLQLSFRITTRRRMETGTCWINIMDSSGMPVGQAEFSPQLTAIPRGTSELSVKLSRIDLAEGLYHFNMAIFSANQRDTIVHVVNCGRLRVVGQPHFWCAYKIPVISVETFPAAASGRIADAADLTRNC